MSVQELRARIVALDNEIELQKQLLGKLEKDKTLALRRLNAALDPVARLPLEISSEIFLQSLAARPGESREGPAGLLRICSAWTDIVLSTPHLWTTICIHFPCGDDFEDVLPIWIRRAGSRPLSMSISLRGYSRNWNHRVSDVLWRHGAQLKHLEILDNDDFALGEDDSDSDDEVIDILGGAASMSLPLLETLAIRCRFQERKYSGFDIMQLLRGAPNIVECSFHNMFILHPRSKNLAVTTLRRLIFGVVPSGVGVFTGNDEIFLCLSLPALETLSLPMMCFNDDDLRVILEKSTPPLRDLTLGWNFHNVDWSELRECLRLIPSLTRFAMWKPDTEAVIQLFANLVDDPSLLPNLRDLTIHIRVTDHSPEPDISESSWRTLVRAVSTPRRMEQLCIGPVAVSPPPDILASLRELVADGANVHVGTEDINFVVPDRRLSILQLFTATDEEWVDADGART
ncbi:hypothetical protein C8R45DRAFT_1143200 [Mycena sanguinolenta]|nr:hypothetical protein C8R45DRAFT_1143200 [Mycena sanguinolenta]